MITLYSSIAPSISITRDISCVGWIGSFHSLALNKRTIYGATSRPFLVRGSSLTSSHLVVMPHLVGWGPAASPGARIGAGVQFWVVGPAVVGCCAATGWRTSCGNRAIACLKFRKIFNCKKKLSKRTRQRMYRGSRLVTAATAREWRNLPVTNYVTMFNHATCSLVTIKILLPSPTNHPKAIFPKIRSRSIQMMRKRSKDTVTSVLMIERVCFHDGFSLNGYEREFRANTRICIEKRHSDYLRQDVCYSFRQTFIREFALWSRV